MTNIILRQATGAGGATFGNSRSGIEFDADACSEEDLHMENIKRRILAKLQARLASPSGSSGISESARKVLGGIRVR